MNDDRPEIDRSEALANWPSVDRSALRTDSGLFSKRRDSMNRAIENANIRGNFASALSRQARAVETASDCIPLTLPVWLKATSFHPERR